MKILKFFFSSLCVFILQACDDDGSAKDDVLTSLCKEDPNNPSCSDLTIFHELPDYFNDYLSSSFNDGDVIDYHWSETIAWYLEPQNESHRHKYGFDMDPYAICSKCSDAVARGRDVYMSVKRGEETYVTIRVDKNEKDKYRFINISDGKIDDSRVLKKGSDVCSDADEITDRFCAKDIKLPAGDYGVYHYNSKTKDYEDRQRYLHIIAYDEKTKQIDYVEFGDESEPGCMKNGVNGCYTKRMVEVRFNEIMAQAVVSAGKTGFTKHNPDYIGLDENFTIDLTESMNATISDDNPIISSLANRIENSEKYGFAKEKQKFDKAYANLVDDYCVNHSDVCKFTESTSLVNKKITGEEFYRTNYAVECGSEECWNLWTNFDFALEDKKKAQKTFESKHLALAINRMRLLWRVQGRNDDIVVLNNYAVFNEALDMMETEKKLQVEIIRDGETVGSKTYLEFQRPTGDGEFVAKVGKILEKSKYYNIVADVLPFIPDPNYDPSQGFAAQITQSFTNDVSPFEVIGGIAFATHLDGTASYNTIVHEIGHTFGLTDLYMAPDDPTIPENYKKADLKASFAFNESNVMSYKIPTGKRIRHRSLLITPTGENMQLYYKDKSGNRIFVTERQWDCIRSSKDCNTL
ncbi:hypothetical protein SAMN05720470_102105 [Fibrobacter sp. UWOV1]|uniref:hypothetical protein n=1 Tax=Fibrobacter sp. UWOV1 TaxID=1896215 RepID=UPI00091CA3DE|nr:hypothetical protein [Fibrobacter sp. UWOV1]SHK69632.1 hypothetical protein SAMN05720470_102105 [Fibrobacter sp. UWOV1]